MGNVQNLRRNAAAVSAIADRKYTTLQWALAFMVGNVAALIGWDAQWWWLHVALLVFWVVATAALDDLANYFRG